MLGVKELVKLHNLYIHHVMMRSEPKNLMLAKPVGRVKLEPLSSFNPAKNPQFYVQAG